MDIIGRKKEIQALKEIYKNKESEFIVVYGRRRVGKTYLINETLGDKYCFQVTGLANATKRQQLSNFRKSFIKYSGNNITTLQNWSEAFEYLSQYIDSLPKGRKVIFFDELPWIAQRGEEFVSALEHFWNGFASLRKDIMLIVCGSATSWITNKIINNKGGLHNRITQKIHLNPFTLKETSCFLENMNIRYSLYETVVLYMITGGIPFYIKQLNPKLSLTQNIDTLCFSEQGLLFNEFNNLYAALWDNAELYISVTKALATNKKGLTREQIIKLSKLQDNGNATKVLADLENCSFIRKYNDLLSSRKCLYQLTDPFTLFYFNFIKNIDKNESNKWLSILGSAEYYAWAGYAFENVCFLHISQIKESLGISHIPTRICSWQGKDNDGKGTQIDMLIDRQDKTINVCEIKFTEEPFTITNAYKENLTHKLTTLKQNLKGKLKNKSLLLTVISVQGLTSNAYSADIYHRINGEDLFR